MRRNINLSLLRRVFLLMIFSLLTSCFSLITFQTADVLPRGEKSAIVGYSRLTNPKSKSDPNYQFIQLSNRVGLGHNFDMGMAITLGYPISLSVNPDIKYQFLRKPFSASFRFGISYYGVLFIPQAKGMVLYQPGVLFSAKHIYFSFTQHIGRIYGVKEETVASSGGFSSLNLGAILGRKVRVLPEVGIAFNKIGTRNPLVIYGIGFIYPFKSKSAI